MSGSRYKLGRSRFTSKGSISRSSALGGLPFISSKNRPTSARNSSSRDYAMPWLPADEPISATAGGGRYLLIGKPFRSTSGKSQIWTGYRAPNDNFGGAPIGDAVTVKISANYEALKRESENYDRIATGLFYGTFVKKYEFLEDADGKGFEMRSALITESGREDLKSFLAKRRGRPLDGSSLRNAAVTAVQCIQAVHSSGMVWTDLKSDNFVLIGEVDGYEESPIKVRGIDLESAMPYQSNPVDYSEEACPPEFAKAFISRNASNFVLDYSYDIWSLGMYLYELGTGEAYFKKSFGQVTKMLGTSKFIADVSSVEDEKLRDLIRICLQPDPLNRPSILQVLLHPYFLTTGIGPYSLS